MKKTILCLTCALASTVAFAQTSTSVTTSAAGDTATTTTSTKTTTSTGTISEYSPGSTFVVKETSGPVKYKYGEKVTYVTKKGKVLKDDEVRTRLKVGAPVHVHYTTKGEDRVIDRVEIDEDDD
jgi:hypothetical protein